MSSYLILQKQLKNFCSNQIFGFNFLLKENAHETIFCSSIFVIET